MNIKKPLAAISALLKARLLKKSTPLVVGWAITDRCNRRCVYCRGWQGKAGTLSTEDIFKIVDELKEAGAIMVSLTGGEPLLREDIGMIVDYIQGKGIEVKLNSNGGSVKEKIGDLKNLARLTLSMEGEKRVHDAIRGEGSYDEVLEAAKCATENGLTISFATVLNRLNLDSIDFILKKAGEFSAKVNFQPATESILGGTDPNPMKPPKAAYEGAIDRLIDKKRAGDRSIANSLTGLRHLRRWPEPTGIDCASGRISCCIEPNGDITYCSREKFSRRPKNCLRDGFKKAFHELESVSCDDCWCAGRVELNLCFSLNPGVIFNQLRRID
jgi:MoaA/NifB/PqqE/SkfB family radical SAM enzyme